MKRPNSRQLDDWFALKKVPLEITQSDGGLVNTRIRATVV